MDLDGIIWCCTVLYGLVALLWVVSWKFTGNSERTTYFHAGLVCFTFGAMSMGMNLLNKSVITALKAPCLVTAVQMACSAITMVALAPDSIRQMTRAQVVLWLIV